MDAKISIKSVSVIGILVAMEIVLAHFSIHTWNLKIGFSFIPIVVAAIFYGPITGGVVAAVGDIISAFLFPVGPYFPGFTLTAFLTGVVFGLFLKKKTSLFWIILAVLTEQIVIGLFLNTYWISFLYGTPYIPLFVTRIYQAAALSLIQVLCILFVSKKLVPVLKDMKE